MRMSHDEFNAKLAEVSEQIRLLQKYEMKCFYNPTPETKYLLLDVIKNLETAVESQQNSEYFDREAEY